MALLVTAARSWPLALRSGTALDVLLPGPCRARMWVSWRAVVGALLLVLTAAAQARVPEASVPPPTERAPVWRVSAPPTSGPGPPAALPTEANKQVPGWMVSQGKTVTYRIAASVDALVVGYLHTGTWWGGSGIALLNALISSALYDLHELAWIELGPDPRSDPTGIALTKTVSYRLLSIANVLLTGLFFTGDLTMSTGLALGNAVIDSTIYFFHELAWTTWGPPTRRDLPSRR